MLVYYTCTTYFILLLPTGWSGRITTIAMVNQCTKWRGWIEQTNATEGCIRYCKLENLPVGTTNTPVIILFCLVVHANGSWSVFAQNYCLTPHTCSLLQGMPEILSPADLPTLVAILDTCTTCKGNPDEEFCQLATSRKGHFKEKGGRAIVAKLDSSPFPNSGCCITTTVCRCDCDILICEDACGPCKRYRPTLRSLLSKSRAKKQTEGKTTASSRVNWRFLNTPERKARVRRQTTLVRMCPYHTKKWLGERQVCTVTGLWAGCKLHLKPLLYDMHRY